MKKIKVFFRCSNNVLCWGAGGSCRVRILCAYIFISIQFNSIHFISILFSVTKITKEKERKRNKTKITKYNEINEINEIYKKNIMKT